MKKVPLKGQLKPLMAALNKYKKYYTQLQNTIQLQNIILIIIISYIS